MADRIAILDGTKLNPGDLSWDGLAAFGELAVYERTPPDVVVERAAGCRYVFTNKTLLPAETIRQLPDLAYIGVLATGYDVVDAAEAVRRGVVVTNVPAYGTDSVAQHAAALMLELARRTAPHAEAVRDGAWSGDGEWCFSVAPITELSGRTLGIVGLGRIGRAFARIGAAMNMAILAGDEHRPDAESLAGLEVEFTGIDELFRRADVLSLHCPLTAETERLVDARRLALMKPEALLINTGRGPLVDSAALAAALEERAHRRRGPRCARGGAAAGRPPAAARAELHRHAAHRLVCAGGAAAADGHRRRQRPRLRRGSADQHGGLRRGLLLVSRCGGLPGGAGCAPVEHQAASSLRIGGIIQNHRRGGSRTRRGSRRCLRAAR